MSNTTYKTDSLSPSYRALVKHALSIGLPGNLKKQEYVDLLRLHRMGFYVDCQRLACIMKTKRHSLRKSDTKKNVITKRSVGRPKKSNIKSELSSDMSPEHITHLTSVITKKPVQKAQSRKTPKPLNYISPISEVPVYSSGSFENVVYQPPIAKSTSQLLRNMLLSTDRTKFNKLAVDPLSGTNLTTSINNNNLYCNFYQYDNSTPLNMRETPHKTSYIANASTSKWKNNIKKLDINHTNEIKSPLPHGNNYIPNIQAFPDIPQLADVDINASFELDNSNYSLNDQTDTDTTVVCIDDSDTLSNQSEENIEQERQHFDQRWAMSIRMENGGISRPLETFDESSLLGPQDTALVQNDVIQHYLETNDVQFLQLPESSCEVIRTLQYYESRLLPNPWSHPEHLPSLNGTTLNEQSELENQQCNNLGTNHTLAEFATLLPCPIAGCLWYSHSATLYVHLFTCHQEMIYYGNSITHVFRCQDIQNFCYFTHLQYMQNTIYIITVAFDCYSRTFVATIQHISSYGDNSSVSSTTAILSTGNLYNNIDMHSWTGPVQPYSVPLDVLHTDGRCLFVDPTNSPEHVIINVNLSVPLMCSNDSMFACL